MTTTEQIAIVRAWIARMRERESRATKAPWRSSPEMVEKFYGQNLGYFEIGGRLDSCWVAKVQNHHGCIGTKPGPWNADLIVDLRNAALPMLDVAEYLVDNIEESLEDAADWPRSFGGPSTRDTELLARLAEMAKGEMTK